jgi:hypothetical protein
MNNYEEDYQAQAPASAVIVEWLKAPLAFFYFFKQRSTIIKHPEVLRDHPDELPDGWIGPLAFALIGTVILVVLVLGMLLLLSRTTPYLSYGNALRISEMQTQLQTIDNQIVTLKEKRNRVANSTQAISSASTNSNDSAAQSLSFLPDSQSSNPKSSNNSRTQPSTPEDFAGELFALEIERASFEKPIRELRWASRFYSAWQVVTLPVTMILAAYACRGMIARLADISGRTVSSGYLFLSASYVLFPAILSAFFTSLFELGIDTSNEVLMKCLYIFSTISALWYLYALFSASRSVSSVLGITRGNGRGWVSFVIVATNVVLFVAWESLVFPAGRMLTAALRKFT